MRIQILRGVWRERGEEGKGNKSINELKKGSILEKKKPKQQLAQKLIMDRLFHTAICKLLSYSLKNQFVMTAIRGFMRYANIHRKVKLIRFTIIHRKVNFLV